MPPSIKKDVLAAIVVGLLGVNGFFIKGLVDKVDSTVQQVYALREDVAALKAKLDVLMQRNVVDSRFNGGGSKDFNPAVSARRQSLPY